MDIVAPAIDEYLTRILPEEHPILREMGEFGRARGFPIIDAQSGRLLHVLARSINAKRVLELGSGFGYSAMWFALAMGEGGLVAMTEGAQENSDRARDYFNRAGMAGHAEFNVGDALAIASKKVGPFDIILCDIDKGQYPAALTVAREKLRIGGYFICDNMLFHGRVLERNPDVATQGVLELTRLLSTAKDFITTIVPVRDGLSLSLRIS